MQVTTQRAKRTGKVTVTKTYQIQGEFTVPGGSSRQTLEEVLLLDGRGRTLFNFCGTEARKVGLIPAKPKREYNYGFMTQWVTGPVTKVKITVTRG